MLIKEHFVVMCCYLYIQRVSKIAVSIAIFPTTCGFSGKIWRSPFTKNRKNKACFICDTIG